MRFKNGGDYRFLSQHLSISWGNWGWGLVFYFIGWQRPLPAIFKEFKHPRFQRRKNSLVEIWTFAFFKTFVARWVSFLNRASHNEVGSNQNNVPANKSSLLLLLLVHSIHFQVFDKKFILELFPLQQSWSFQGWTKNWFDFQSLICSKDGSVSFFGRLERSDMAGLVAENHAEEF